MTAAGLGHGQPDEKLAKAFIHAQSETNKLHAQSRRTRRALARLQAELDARGISINVEVEK